MWEISARVRVLARNWRNKADIAKHKIITFAPIIALATLKAVLCTAVKWDARDAENTAGNARRCHSGHHNSSHFHPGNRAEHMYVFIWQNFQPTYWDPRWKNAISCVFRRKFCAVISCLFYWFYPSVVLLVRSSVRKKGSETVTPSRMLQGRDVYPSDGQTPLQLLLVCFFFPPDFSCTHAGRMCL